LDAQKSSEPCPPISPKKKKKMYTGWEKQQKDGKKTTPETEKGGGGFCEEKGEEIHSAVKNEKTIGGKENRKRM